MDSPGTIAWPTETKKFLPQKFLILAQKTKTKKLLHLFERTDHLAHPPDPPPKKIRRRNFYVKYFLYLPTQKKFFKRKNVSHLPERTDFLLEKNVLVIT